MRNFFVFVLSISAILFGMMGDEFELPNLPQLVDLISDESDNKFSTVNMSALDKTLHAEDFGSDFW